LFIDEIDAITPKRDSSARGMERRMVAQLLTCMDSLSNPDQPTSSPLVTKSAEERPLNPLLPPPPLSRESSANSTSNSNNNNNSNSNSGRNMNRVIVIGATTKPDSVDGSLRRAGRFDREVGIPIPDQAAREKILSVLCHSMRLAPNIDFSSIAKKTPGYVGADMMSLAKEAGMAAIQRISSQHQITDSCCLLFCYWE
jgi:ribosome biogenesis ATPase